MTARYAEGTSVPIAKSRDEIERLLARHDATGFIYGEQGNRAMIAFELQGRRYRMELRYPSGAMDIHRNQYTRHKSDEQLLQEAFSQEKRRLWRGLALLVKGKLEAVASGISTLEEEMLSYTVMPNNQTVGEWLSPQLASVYRTGSMPPLLPGGNNHKAIGVIEGEVV